MSRFVGFRRLIVGGLLLAVVTLVGCGGSDSGTVKVSGTVKFSDGTVPAGEVAIVRFEPATPGPKAKAASGDIKPDGTFVLTTMMPGDGAYPGEYKVTFSVFDKYAPPRKELVEASFTKPDTTKHTASVKKNGDKFDFIVEKAK